jgi:hypothetical protein
MLLASTDFDDGEVNPEKMEIKFGMRQSTIDA